MFFQYGSYIHGTNEVALQDVRREVVRDQRGFRKRIRHTWQLRGTLIPSTATSSQITAEASVLQAAYSDGSDAGLFEDNGTPTIYFLDSSRAIGGVRVMDLSFPDGVGAAYVTHLRFAITLQADFPDIDGNLALWIETLRFIGDAGPVYAWQTPIVGPPVRQQISARSTQRVIQTGQAVGFLSPIRAPSPRWPSLEHRDRRQVTTGTPAINTGSANTYPTQWSYEFESMSDLSGNGTVRPRTV